MTYLNSPSSDMERGLGGEVNGQVLIPRSLRNQTCGNVNAFFLKVFYGARM